MSLKTVISQFTAHVAASLKLRPYPVVLIGRRKLIRSVLPPSESKVIKVYLDEESNRQLTQKAWQLGCTNDELIRRLIWEVNAS